LVRNIGTRASTFTVSSEQPFSITPSTCHLDIHEAAQFTVSFTPLRRGDYESVLLVHYDTGETAPVKVIGSGIDVNVQVERPSLRMPPTYINSVVQKKIKVQLSTDSLSSIGELGFLFRSHLTSLSICICIYSVTHDHCACTVCAMQLFNRSDVIAKFALKRFPSAHDDLVSVFVCLYNLCCMCYVHVL